VRIVDTRVLRNNNPKPRKSGHRPDKSPEYLTILQYIEITRQPASPNFRVTPRRVDDPIYD